MEKWKCWKWPGSVFNGSLIIKWCFLCISCIWIKTNSWYFWNLIGQTKWNTSLKIKRATILRWMDTKHWVKTVRIRSSSGLHFSRIFQRSDWIRRDTEYLPVFSPNTEKCGKNADQNYSEYGHILRSETLNFQLRFHFKVALRTWYS